MGRAPSSSTGERARGPRIWKARGPRKAEGRFECGVVSLNALFLSSNDGARLDPWPAGDAPGAKSLRGATHRPISQELIEGARKWAVIAARGAPAPPRHLVCLSRFVRCVARRPASSLGRALWVLDAQRLSVRRIHALPSPLHASRARAASAETRAALTPSQPEPCAAEASASSPPPQCCAPPRALPFPSPAASPASGACTRRRRVVHAALSEARTREVLGDLRKMRTRRPGRRGAAQRHMCTCADEVLRGLRAEVGVFVPSS